MKLIEWVFHRFSKRNNAETFYRRGMAKAKKHNHQGAIEDYTKALELPDISAELNAMILYNRGLVYVAAGMAQKGADDLNAVLTMDEAGANVKKAAQGKLARIQSRSSKHAV